MPRPTSQRARSSSLECTTPREGRAMPQVAQIPARSLALVLVGGRRRPALPGPAAPDLQHVAQPEASTPSTPSPAERLTEGPARPLSGAQAVTLPVPP